MTRAERPAARRRTTQRHQRAAGAVQCDHHGASFVARATDGNGHAHDLRLLGVRNREPVFARHGESGADLTRRAASVTTGSTVPGAAGRYCRADALGVRYLLNCTRSGRSPTRGSALAGCVSNQASTRNRSSVPASCGTGYATSCMTQFERVDEQGARRCWGCGSAPVRPGSGPWPYCSGRRRGTPKPHRLRARFLPCDGRDR